MPLDKTMSAAKDSSAAAKAPSKSTHTTGVGRDDNKEDTEEEEEVSFTRKAAADFGDISTSVKREHLNSALNLSLNFASFADSRACTSYRRECPKVTRLLLFNLLE